MKLKCRPVALILITLAVMVSLVAGGCGFGLGKPAVKQTDPTDGATGVPLDKTITVTFDKNIKPHEKWSDVTLKQGSTLIPTTNSINGAVLTIDPVDELEGGKVYTVTLPAKCVRTRNSNNGRCVSPDGEPNNAYSFSFTTETGITAPAVSTSDPAQGASGVFPDKTVTVTFNKEIVQGDSFSGITLVQGASAVPANVSISATDAKVLTVDPVNDLALETQFTLTIPAGAVKDQETSTVAMAGDYTLTFTTGGPPAVTVTDPADGQVNVPWDKTVTVTFSENIQQGTNYQLITLKKGTVDVAFTKSIDGAVLSITPDEELEKNVDYTVTVPAGAVNDMDGFALAAATVFSFRTSDPPRFVSSDPADGASNVSLDKTVAITFSKNVVQGDNFDSISIKAGSTDVAAVKSVSGSTLTINPSEDLAQDTSYTVTIPAGAVKSDTDEPLSAESTFSFLTGYPPTVVSTTPSAGAAEIPGDTAIRVVFDENILPASAWDGISLKAGTTVIPATVTYADNILTITPNAKLTVTTAYTVSVPSQAVRDQAGNVRTDSYSFGFTTGNTFFVENFDSGIPATWTIVDGENDGLTWTVVDPGTFNIGSPFTNPCGIVDSNQAGAAYMDEQLISPVIDISNRSTGNIQLEFANCFTYYAYGMNEIADVDIQTFDGTNWGVWTNVLTMTGRNFGPELRIIDLNTLVSGKSAIKIRFHYYNARNEFWWLIDDVRVYEN